VTRRSWLAIAALVLAAVGGGLFWARRRPPVSLAWQGYAEADYVKVGPVLAGLLTAVPVQRGDAVAAGTLLFTQDDAAERAARDQAARQLDQALEQLANLQSGGKQTEIQQAEANLADTQATMARAGADLERAQILLRNGFATHQNVDQLSAEFRSAQAKVAANEAALAQLRNPLGRAAEIKAQDAAVAATRAAIRMADWRMAQRRVEAPTAARVADVLARPGETMAAGTPVVALLPPANIFVRFFVPEADLARMHLGEELAIGCDSCRPGLRATVSFIAPQAEYTPPVIYSEESRAKLVFLIEARPPLDQAPLLNPGQPVTVRPVSGP